MKGLSTELPGGVVCLPRALHSNGIARFRTEIKQKNQWELR